MASHSKSLTARVLFWLAGAIYDHRGWFLWPQLALVALSIWFTVEKLEFHTSRDNLVGADRPYRKVFHAFKKEFPVQDAIVVVVESADLDKNRQFVERLGARMERETNLLAGTFYKGDLKLLGPKALLFLPEAGLKDLQKTLLEYQPFLQQFTRATNLVTLFDLINTQIRTAKEENNVQNRSLVKALPALEKIVNEADDGLGRLGRPPAPGVNALFEGGKEAELKMYITFTNGHIFLITAQAKAESLNKAAVTRLRELIEETKLEVSGLNVGLTGEPVLEVDEMAQSQVDSTLATVVSLIAVALIFIYGYNETGRPLKATACLLVGLAYTMGYTTLAVGHLNILTIMFLPILIGLAIDFGVHLVTRYEEELWHGATERQALETSLVFTGTGIFTGALTTAAAFFAMGLTDFKGIREMGIICGGGLLACLVPMLTLLPVLILRGRQNVLDHELAPKLDRQAAFENSSRARIENVWLNRPRTTIAVVLAITGLSVWSGRRVAFDYNLLNMQSAGLPAVIFQDKLIHSSDRSVLYGAVVATNLTQATNLIHQITNLSTVASIDSMAGFFAADQREKLRTLGDIKQIAAGIAFPQADTALVNTTELDRSLFSTHGYLGLIAQKVQENDPALYTNVVGLREAISRLRHRMLVEDKNAVSNKLAVFQQGLFGDVRQTFVAIRDQDNSGPLAPDDLPPVLRHRFVGVSGKHLIQVYPKKNIWNREAQQEFIADLQKIDPNVTGTPVQLLEYTGLLKSSYEEAALYSLAAIAFMVLVHFRRLSCIVLALLPVGLGYLWMVGLMGVCRVSFNPANIMTLPLIVGVGVTNGIHILNRFAEEEHPSILALSTGKAIIVSALTTIAGFGSLILAKHQGIASLGFIMGVGTATCMIAALTFLPAVLNLLSKRGWKIRKSEPAAAVPSN